MRINEMSCVSIALHAKCYSTQQS